MDSSGYMSAYKMLQRTMVLCLVILVGLGLAVLFLALHTSQTRCDQSQEIRSYIFAASERGIKTLPTISYYKEHPGELAVQMKILEDQRDTFATPLDCSLLPA